ncbi:MAG: chromate efflux transporter [Gammaproteobacteria bacterium]|nr:chromate efflux transporter [Gammaproteobacteria bacterium]
MDNVATAEKTPVPLKPSLWFLFKTFVAIGSVAFGGFMALISVIENKLSKEHKLVEHNTMLDAIALANLLPGPQAVNVVAFLGYRLRGPLGAFLCSFAVILPTFILIMVLSYLYFRYGEIHALQKIFNGFIPAVAAIVISVVWRMAKKTVRAPRDAGLVVLAFVVLLLTPLQYKIYATFLIIVLFGFIGYQISPTLAAGPANNEPLQVFSKLRLGIVVSALATLLLLWFLPLPLEHNSLLFFNLTVASMSLMLFGGGYVFIPVIGSVVVLQYHWVTQQEFTDAIAMGQITPGPILISVAVIGYKLHGWWGALLATFAIYTPPAVLMVTASQALSYIKRSSTIRAAMHGIHCGVIGMIAMAALVLLQTALPHTLTLAAVWPTGLILAMSLIALLRFNLDVIWIIPPAGLLGYLLY